MLTLLGFIATLVIIVGVHEYGHYLAARMCGVRVLAYAIGFGPPLVKWSDRHGTEWRLCPIPLGGYVLMLNNPEEAATMNEPPERSLEGIPRWHRAWVIFAGPLANFLLTFVLLFAAALIGEESLRARVGRVVEGSTAQLVGFVAGDDIIAIDGHRTLQWTKVIEGLIFSIGDHDAEVEVSAQSGVTRKLSLPTGETTALTLLDSPGPLGNLGLVPDTSYVTMELDLIIDGTAAAAAGLRKGDTVVAAGGTVLEDWDEFVTVIQEVAGQELELLVARDGGVITLTVVPQQRANSGGGYLGVVPFIDLNRRDELLVRQRAGPLEALALAARNTIRGIATTTRFMGLMLTGNLSAKNLSGPIGIARQASSAVSLGPLVFILFIAHLSLSLGLINLVPIPILDGGHLLRYAVEGVMGRPLSARITQMAAGVGVSLLFALLLFTVYNDLA